MDREADRVVKKLLERAEGVLKHGTRDGYTWVVPQKKRTAYLAACDRLHDAGRELLDRSAAWDSETKSGIVCRLYIEGTRFAVDAVVGDPWTWPGPATFILHLYTRHLVADAALPEPASLAEVMRALVPVVSHDRRYFSWMSEFTNVLDANFRKYRKHPLLIEPASELAKAIGEVPIGWTIRQISTGIAESPIGLPYPWSRHIVSGFESLTPDQRWALRQLLKACKSVEQPRPPKKWLRAASEWIEVIGSDTFRALLIEVFELALRPTEAEPGGDENGGVTGPIWQVDAYYAKILKGLVWASLTVKSEDVARALGPLAVSAYKKIPGIGPRMVAVGNAAVYALGQIPGRVSLGQLAYLKVKVKFGSAQKMLDKALDAAAEREGLPRDEIEEMAVPAYGLTEVGALDEPMGEHTALLRITGTAGAASTTLTWRNAKGKVTKSVPAPVKAEHADELKDLKASMKDIQKMLPAQRDRIDSMFLDRRSWAVPTWRERYLDHPLVGTIARRLIWLFDDGRERTAAAWLADDPKAAAHGPGRLVRADGTPFEPDAESTTVSMWHPIDADAEPGSAETRGDIAAWREFYQTNEIRQPFKQAHREVYLLTDAERRTEMYSNRFAAHVLRQHQFNALCAARGWKAKLRLMVDDEYPPPSRRLQAWGLRAEFWVEGVGDDYVDAFVLDSGAFRFVSTDQVRFYDINAGQNIQHATGGRYETVGRRDRDANHPLRLDEIPPIVLSEILRDIDLFVGVGSVGNNPEWNDGGPGGHFREYWERYAFGDLGVTAQTRRELLENLVPRLMIASACTVTGRFLVVLGKKRTYKIHLGSGNILMEPNDQYLCIVPNSAMEAGPAKGKLFLPFEGDRTLAVILSKAFMLAKDDQIKDRSILSQIERR
ncbi:MAG: DUF4132 domain-containing protein [Planctomycetota bacterium]